MFLKKLYSLDHCSMSQSCHYKTCDQTHAPPQRWPCADECFSKHASISSTQCASVHIVFHQDNVCHNFCICIIIHLSFLDIFNGQLFFKKLTTFTDYQSIPKIFLFHYSINKIFVSYFHSATLYASYYFNWREFLSSDFLTVIHAFWY